MVAWKWHVYLSKVASNANRKEVGVDWTDRVLCSFPLYLAWELVACMLGTVAVGGLPLISSLFCF